MKIVLVIFSIAIFRITTGYSKYYNYVEEVFKWKTVQYEYLLRSENSYVGPYKYYIPENNDVVSFGYHPLSGLMIVSIVRLRPGIPTSLGAFCVSDYKPGSSPKIWGFPNWPLNNLLPSDFTEPISEDEWRKGLSKPNHHYVHQRPFYENPPTTTIVQPLDIKRIISVFHLTIDEKCNRVFFMDNGLLQYYQNTTYAIQRPSLWVIDLPSNGCDTREFSVILRKELPDKISAKGSNGFMITTLDYQSDSCDDLFLYIANAFYSYLVVYDFKKDEFWSFDHETFHPVIAESHMVFDKKLNYEFPLGIFNTALGYPDENGDRIAYYSPVAGTALFAVSTKILKNRRKSPANFKPDDFRIIGYRGYDHQPLKFVIDYTYGVMFFTEAQSYQIRCWNINKPLNPDYIDVVYESEKLLFGLQMFIDSRGYLWFHTDHIPVDWTTDIPLNLNEVNSRIFRIKVSDAIRGTICDVGAQDKQQDLYN